MNVADLELGVQTALVTAPPFGLMNEVGVAKSLDLVKQYAKQYKGFVVPRCIEKQAATKKPFEIPVVIREDRDGIAVLTIRRPNVLNALNRDVYEQLDVVRWRRFSNHCLRAVSTPHCRAPDQYWTPTSKPQVLGSLNTTPA